MALKSVDIVLARNSRIHHIVAVSTLISVGFTWTCRDLGGTGGSSTWLVVTIETNKVGFFEVVTPLGDVRCFICASETFLLVFWLSRLCFLTDFVDQKFYGLTKLCSFQ